MKTMKTILALLLALTLTLALAAPVFATEPAEEPTYTITIQPKEGDTGAHTYGAYQLFKGTVTVVNNQKVLTNIAWGDNVDQTKLGTLANAINALLDTDPETEGNQYPEGYTALTAESTAQNFADAITALNAAADDAKARAVADAFGAALTGSAKGTGSANLGNEDDADDNAVITGLPGGYYLVKDQEGNVENQGPKTRYILEVVGNVTVTAKNVIPSITKQIDGDNDLTTTNDRTTQNNASVGDKITYVLTSAVPDMTGYNAYYFILNDTLSAGLTFNNDVAITIGTTTLVKDTDFTVTVTEGTGDDAGKTLLKIVLHNFIQYQDQAGAAITVSYSATLDEDAVIGKNGNANDVTLTFSNDPGHQYGDDDEPGSGEPVGVTPKSTVYTFATEIELTKVDESDNTLTGAKFQITGEKVSVVMVNTAIYVPIDGEPAAGVTVYYMLKNGSYTTEAPTTETADNYDSDTKYQLIEEVTSTSKTEPIVTEGYVNSNGVLTFTGLAAGTYTITELVAPNGYNLLTTPITVDISAEYNTTATPVTCTWSATVNGSDATVDENGIIKFNVENKQGSQLPTTGGIGTTIFYVVGGLLVVVAGVLLIARKRASTEK